MKKGIKIGITVFLCLLLVSAFSIYTIPQLRVSLFVNTYHDLIETGLDAGNGVPADDTLYLDIRR